MRKVTALAAALALVWAVPAGARQHASACQKLTGKDLAPSKTVKLVQKRHKSGASELVGCVLPKGKVRTIAIDAADGTQAYTVHQVAGKYVLLDATSTAADHTSTSHATAVVNLETGRAYFIIARANHKDQEYASYITTRGTAIAAVGPAAIDEVQIRVYSPAGVQSVVDDATKEVIPPTSLELNGNVATWVHGMEVRTLTI